MNSAENHMTELDAYMTTMGRQARAASRAINRATSGQKNQALLAIASGPGFQQGQPDGCKCP
jgi:type II secretory pathway component PulJ